MLKYINLLIGNYHIYNSTNSNIYFILKNSKFFDTMIGGISFFLKFNNKINIVNLSINLKNFFYFCIYLWIFIVFFLFFIVSQCNI